MIVTIDGLSGAGKGTLSKKISKYFNLKYLETGNLYRIISSKCIEYKINIIREDLIFKIAKKLTIISFLKKTSKLYIKKNNSQLSSKIASILKIRNVLLIFQRKLCKFPYTKNGIILDGRDTGTKIYPKNQFKFFLKSDLIIRSKRRFKEIISKKIYITFKNILRNLIKRDFRDISRHRFPLSKSKDAITINSSYLNKIQTFNYVINNIKKIYIQKIFNKSKIKFNTIKHKTIT
jgi:cytidylate kinase